jgi:HlyD family secretion protein
MKWSTLWWLAALALIVGVVTRSDIIDRGVALWGTTIAAPHQGTPYRIVHVIAEGRVVAYPGAEVVVGAEMAGMITGVHVHEKETVRKGGLIAELKSDELRASRAEALAKIAEADADIHFFEREVKRTEALRIRQAGSQSELDKSRRELEASRARKDAAIATRDRYDALIAMTRITSPIDGVVIARYVHSGEMVAVATKIVSVADLKKVRIEAEVDEFDIERVKLGDPATIRAEGFVGTAWHGTVEEIPDAVVTRRVRPEDPGRPIDSRVLLVKIALDQPGPLKLGQRVEVEIRPRNRASARD